MDIERSAWIDGTSLTRILFVDHVGVLAGAEWSLLDLARHHRFSCRVVLLADGPFREALEAEDIPVSVIAAAGSVGRVTRQGSILRTLPALPSLVSMTLRLARAARSFDLIYANTQKAFVVGGIAGLLARRPVVWHLRDVMTAQHFGALHRKLAITLANRLCARVIANSDASANAFSEAGGQADLVTVVHNGVSSAAFDAVSSVDVDQARKELALGDVPVIGVFSRMSQWKGQHILLDALPDLPGVHALIVGEALFGEDAYADDLRHRAEELGVADRAHFLGFRTDVPVLMRLCDVILQTSVSPEPFGRVVVEGMLAERPVVAMKAGGPLEIITNGIDGVLVDPDDAGALANAVRDLLSDEQRRRVIAEAGRKTALSRFSVEHLLARTSEEIESVIRLGRRRMPTDRGPDTARD